MMQMRMLSLCAGIGGADLAASWTGAITVVGQVELDTFCLAVLERHFPNTKRLTDIREVRGNEFGDIDIIVAGIPCQNHSVAGKRKAARDERDLWPFVCRILGRAQPRWFVLENVPGLLSSKDEQGRKGGFFAAIVTNLASMGYRVGWSLFGASEVGAPHQRRRVFVVAYSGGDRLARRQDQHQSGGECQTPTNIGENGNVQPMAHSLQQRLQEWHQRHDPARTHPEPDGYRTDSGDSQSRVGRVSDGFPDRLDCHRWPAGPGQAQHEWEPPRTITEREPHRRARLKALGNAIVPQQIFPLLAAIVETEQQLKRANREEIPKWTK